MSITLEKQPKSATTTLAPSVAQLLLVRMALPGKRPAPPATVRKDLESVLGRSLTSEQIDALREDLLADGFLLEGKRKGSFVVSAAGMDHVLHTLGVKQFPENIKWNAVIARFWFPQAAGLSEQTASKLKTKGQLIAFELKQRFSLPNHCGGTLNQVLEAIVCKQLGYPQEVTLASLSCRVLSEMMDSKPLTKQQIQSQLPKYRSGLKTASADEIRAKFVQTWLADNVPRASDLSPRESDESSSAKVPFDLQAFATAVKQLAQESTPAERFHNQKVFIAAVWSAAQRMAAFPHMTISEFKQRLIEANSQNLLQLARADLVQAMHPTLVAESEIKYLNASFHFVLIAEK